MCVIVCGGGYVLGEQSINPGAYIVDQSGVGVPEEVERLAWGSGVGIQLAWGSGVGTQLAWEMRHDLPTAETSMGGEQRDRKSTRLNSSHIATSRMPSSA